MLRRRSLLLARGTAFSSMTTLALQIVLLATVAVPAADAPAEDLRWGNLKGKFVYDGEPPAPAMLPIAGPRAPAAGVKDESLVVDAQGGGANVVVFVRTKDVAVHPRAGHAAPQKVVFEAKAQRFEPHVLPIMISQKLVVKNSEAVAVNANLMEVGAGGANILLTPGAQHEFEYARPQAVPQPVTSNIQPWMRAYILPRDNPYVAVSQPDGTFEIHGLPLGALEFQVWHEKAGNFKEASIDGWKLGRFSLQIKPGDTDLGVIKLDPKLFQPNPAPARLIAAPRKAQ